MRRVVSLLHRQAVKAKAEGLFFKVRVSRLFDLRRYCAAGPKRILILVFSSLFYVGVNTRALQDDPGRSEVFTTRAAIQGPGQSYQFHLAPIL